MPSSQQHSTLVQTNPAEGKFSGVVSLDAVFQINCQATPAQSTDARHFFIRLADASMVLSSANNTGEDHTNGDAESLDVIRCLLDQVFIAGYPYQNINGAYSGNQVTICKSANQLFSDTAAGNNGNLMNKAPAEEAAGGE